MAPRGPAYVALAPGKVNVCLFVGTARADGLHPLVSIVQAVSLADELHLQPAPPGASTDEVVCPGVEGPNLAARALADYRSATGWDAPPQRLTITKHVPVSAGMGGGSGDAAAALRLAARAAGRPGDPVLLGLAAGLGADVPAQLEPGRVLVTGAGERVEPLGEPGPFGVLVLPADGALSTPVVYAEADRLGLPRPAADLAEREREVRAAAAAPWDLPAEVVHNDLEAAARALFGAVDDALAAARAAGADHALVSGSGPTVVGLFTGPRGVTRARAAVRELAEAHPHAVAAEPVTAHFARVRAAEPRS